MIIKANTPCEAKIAIVEWLLQEATAYRSKARVSERKHYKQEQLAIADAMSAAGNFILAMKIEGK